MKLEPRASGPTPLVVSYLGAGASWAPSYVVDIGDPGWARLTAKAEVFSEGEDLENTEVRFVTGFPNLGFRGVTSPIAMQGKLPDFLLSLYRSDRLAAEMTTLAKGLKKTNPNLRLFLKLPIESGATASARYVYRLYVRG